MARKDGRPRSVTITLPLDPMPWVLYRDHHATGQRVARYQEPIERNNVEIAVSFDPRPGYSQNQEDYS